MVSKWTVTLLNQGIICSRAKGNLCNVSHNWSRDGLTVAMSGIIATLWQVEDMEIS